MSQNKIEKLKNFIHTRITQIDQQLSNSRIASNQASFATVESQQEKLHLATKRLTFSNILSSYMHDTVELSKSYMIQAEIYFQLECFDQAISNAKMAKKSMKRHCGQEEEGQKSQNCKEKQNKGGHSNNSQQQCKLNQSDLESIEMLIVKCLIAKGKYDQAEENIEKLQIKLKKEDFYRAQCQVLVKLKKEQKSREIEEKLERLIEEKYGKKSLEYGLFGIEKGRNFAAFNKFPQAISQMSNAMNILIEKKFKNALQIFRIYFDMASYQKKIGDYEGQISSLVCSMSMIRQLPNQQKQIIQLTHLIVKNYKVRQLYQKALAELQKVQILQREVFGETSSYIGNTLKQMSQLMAILGKKNDAKKYQQEYMKIFGTSDKSRMKLAQSKAK